MSARELTTRALIIARMSAGEGSVRVLLYTESLGLVAALAKSAREERSKLRPHLQPGTHGVFRLVKGRDVWRVATASDTTNVYFALSERIEAREALARILSALRQFIHGEGKENGLFETLWEFVHILPALVRAEDVRTAEALTMLRILAVLGYAGGIDAFLGSAYDSETLDRATRERTRIVTVVNDAIAASGL